MSTATPYRKTLGTLSARLFLTYVHTRSRINSVVQDSTRAVGIKSCPLASLAFLHQTTSKGRIYIGLHLMKNNNVSCRKSTPSNPNKDKLIVNSSKFILRLDSWSSRCNGAMPAFDLTRR